MAYYGAEEPSPSIGRRLKNAWNVFRNKDPSDLTVGGVDAGGGVVSSFRPDKFRSYHYGIDQSIAISIYNRIATDASSVIMHHCRLDYMGGFVEEIDSGLNNCLTVSANIDQTGQAFLQDLVMSILDEGVVAAVPVDTISNPLDTESYNILSMRVGKISQWWPSKVQIELYDDRKGVRDYVVMPKDKVAIIENPFYAVMNEPNSVLKRLTRKLALLDAVDEASSSGKLDLIIQLPYVTKSKTRQTQAEQRRKQLEDQLANSKYGIGYIDGTERVTQLNRAVENNLMAQIEYLTNMVYSQLGMTQDILNGTASEETMTNYYKRTIDVILSAIANEFSRKFLTKTARTQRQAVKFYRDPFSLTPTNAIADIADKFTRNEILSPNEVRGIVGFKPSADPKADELRNRNISQSSEEIAAQQAGIYNNPAIEAGRRISESIYRN